MTGKEVGQDEGELLGDVVEGMPGVVVSGKRLWWGKENPAGSRV